MWFVFDADDFFEGGAGLIMLIIKLALLMVFVLLPIQFFDIANRASVIAISLGLTISSLVLTIFSIVYSIKVYKNIGDVQKKKTSIRKIILYYIILFVVLSLIGFMCPLVFYFGTYKLSINRISSMILMPTILNLLFIFYIKSDFLEYKKGKRFKCFLDNLKTFIFKILKIIGIPLYIVYWIIMILSIISNEGTIMYNFTNKMIDCGNKYYVYYDTKYEKVREEKSVHNFIEEFIIKVKNEYYYDQEAKQLVSDRLPNRVGERIDHYWTENDDIKIFSFVYLVTNYKTKVFLNEFGIDFKDDVIVDSSIIAVHYFDKMTLKDEYIKINLDTNKVIEEITSSDFVNYDFFNHHMLYEQ